MSLRSGAAVAKALAFARPSASTNWIPSDNDWELPPEHAGGFPGLARHLWRGRDGAATTGRIGHALHRLRRRGQPPWLRQSFDQTKTAWRPAFRRRGSWCLTRRTASWPMGWQPPVVSETGPARLQRRPAICGARRRLEQAPGRSVAPRFPSLDGGKNRRTRNDGGHSGGQALPVVEVRPKRASSITRTNTRAGAAEHFCPADVRRGDDRPNSGRGAGRVSTPLAGAIMRAWM